MDAITEMQGRIAAAANGTGQMPSGGGGASFQLARRDERSKLPPPVVPGTPYYNALLKSQSRPDDEPEVVLTAIANEEGKFDPNAVVAIPPSQITEPVAAQSQPLAITPGVAKPAKRVVVSYGPKEGVLIVAVELAPDWDTEDPPIEMETDVVKQMIPVIKMLDIKVKSLVPGL